MKEQTNRLKDMDEVSKDTVYSEMYIEMRRFRDYQLRASMWYTTILISILGFVFTFKFAHIQYVSFQAFRTSFIVKLLIFIVVTVIGGAACLTVLYTNNRYFDIRRYVDKYVEPKWEAESWQKWERLEKYEILEKDSNKRDGKIHHILKIPHPHIFIFITLLILTIVTDLIILLPF